MTGLLEGALWAFAGGVAGGWVGRKAMRAELEVWRETALRLGGLRSRVRDVLSAWDDDDATTLVQRMRELRRELERADRRGTEG